MKEQWVLNDEERLKFLKSRRKWQDTKQPRAMWLLTEAESKNLTVLLEESGFFEPSKVKDISLDLVREFIQLVAFKQDLSQKGKAELKQVLEARAKSFTQSVPFFAGFSEARRKRLIAKNVPLIVQMQICTYFNPELTWRQQLTPIIGPAEVDILDSKLKEAKMGDKDFRLFYSSLFPSPPPKYHDQFTDLLTDISGWPTDETEYLLMTLILLFSPNSLPQAEFGLVERFQQEYFTLLQKYLDKKHMTDPDKSMAKFLSSVDILVKCTEMKHMFFGMDV